MTRAFIVKIPIGAGDDISQILETLQEAINQVLDGAIVTVWSGDAESASPTTPFPTL